MFAVSLLLQQQSHTGIRARFLPTSFNPVIPLSDMKNVNPRDKSETSRSSSALQNALILMDEHLTAWRRSLESPGPGEPQSHLDKFLVAAREGYRLMALKRGQTADAADDIAQTCVLGLIKRMRASNRPPFVPSLIDTLLVGGSKPGKKPASYSTPLVDYLYGMLSKGVGEQARLMRLRARRLIAADPDTEDGRRALLGRQHVRRVTLARQFLDHAVGLVAFL